MPTAFTAPGHCRRRHYYATQGPDLCDLRIEGKEIVIESSAVERMIVHGHGSAALCETGRSLTRTRMKRARFAGGPWIRVTMTDAAGRQAWSHAVWRG